eukprot:1290888-Rhodomonas_salina.2
MKCSLPQPHTPRTVSDRDGAQSPQPEMTEREPEMMERTPEMMEDKFELIQRKPEMSLCDCEGERGGSTSRGRGGGCGPCERSHAQCSRALPRSCAPVRGGRAPSANMTKNG